jgi:hypothetical protein
VGLLTIEVRGGEQRMGEETRGAACCAPTELGSARRLGEGGWERLSGKRREADGNMCYLYNLNLTQSRPCGILVVEFHMGASRGGAVHAQVLATVPF